ncbi:MAG TPA: prepilin-type N-terminal cleavage/methylation domain-containing protein [Candidatus Paceibacterota bacterium]|nr:prepilin-type N-terminal cleavage/methylation domain-containing protein [Candidatus Paceibacterota bacterium]
MRSFFFKQTRERGFTLVELLVVIAIFGLLTTVIFARQSQFSGSTLLTNVAYQIALTIRQAQVYGLSVREFSAGANPFNYPYGVHFDKTAGLNTSIIFFADNEAPVPVPATYDPRKPAAATVASCGTANSPCLDLLTITRGNFVYDLCAQPSGGGSCVSADELDISFVRPDPEARIVGVRAGVPDDGNNIRGCVTLKSLEGTLRYVVVTNTGQITVSASSCL